jgi:hypothetical protein
MEDMKDIGGRDNFNTELEEIEVRIWISLSQIRFQCSVPVNAVKDLLGEEK